MVTAAPMFFGRHGCAAWLARLTRNAALLLAAAVAAGCGDRATAPGPTAAAMQFAARAGAAAEPSRIDVSFLQRRTALAAGDAPAVRRAAVELFELGEREFPQFFPSRQPDRSAGIFAYRHYPETGAYLLVDQNALQVYVLGGPFGPVVIHVGDVIAYVPCVTVSIGFPEEGFNSPGGGGDSPGTDGGVGGSSADGAIRGADVKLFDNAGTLIGSAVSDEKGTVRLKACGGTGPFRIEYQGNAEASYFDEAIAISEAANGVWRPFPAGETLVAYVPDLNNHVAVSTLTNAAAQIIESPGGGNLAPPPGGPSVTRLAAPPRSAAVATTAQRIASANATVRNVINQQLLGTGLAVADIARPPALAYSPASLQALGNDDRGRYAQTLVALAKSAAAFNPQLASPAREMTKQLSRDLGDGVFDGRDRQGTPVAPPASRAYDVQTFPTTVATQAKGRLTQQVVGSGSITTSPPGEPCASGGGSCYTWNATVTLTARPTGSATFQGWTGACTGTGACTLTMSGDKSVTATFSSESQYTLSVGRSGPGQGTVSSVPAGIDCGSSCSRAFATGSQVTLTATPTGSGSTFAGWSGDCTGSAPTCTVTMSAARNVTANFGSTSATLLTVNNLGSGGGTVSSSPSGISCPGSCSAGFAPGSTVTLTAVAAADSSFAGWSGDCSGLSPTCTVTLAASRTVNANFNLLILPSLTVNKEGSGRGTVSSTPAGLLCDAICTTRTSNSFARGSPVTLTAVADPASVFVGWSGDCSGSAPTCTVSAIGARTVRATFNFVPLLSVAKTGSGSGTLRSTPAGIDCGPGCSNASAVFAAGASVRVEAIAAAGSVFVRWIDGCGADPVCTVTMDRARSLTAEFGVPLLTVSRAGSGSGTVSSTPAGINCGTTCTFGGFTVGSTVTLTATPAVGSVFSGWDGACSGSAPSCNVTMSAARNVTARFDAIELFVTRSGSGSGSVVSSPPGINCGTTCLASVFGLGSTVTLTATPDAASLFAGWSDACLGTTPSCNVTMSGSRHVDAAFEVPLLSVTRIGSGTVSSAPSGIDCGTGCSTRFPAGSIVTLTATATSGWTFSGWSGACTGTSTTCAVTMNAVSRSVTATFVIAGGSVSTLAGTGASGATNGPGSSATFFLPHSVPLDAAGNVYVTDNGNNLLRKITPAGLVSTLAGRGTPGWVDGPGPTAAFDSPYGAAVDAAGNIYIADSTFHLIRRVTPAGVVSTYAGTGSPGAVNGARLSATFNGPHGVAIDSAGNLYVADESNHLVRKITPAGVVSTLAGSGEPGFANGTGFAASFRFPKDVAVDAAGNVFVADHGNNRIRRITPAGVVTTWAGSGATGAVNGAAATASFNSPHGVALDSAGNVYVADEGNHMIRRISAGGIVSTLAGTGVPGAANGPLASATFNLPYGVAVGPDGNVYVGDWGNNMVRKITLP